MIAVIKYSGGNLASLTGALERLKQEYVVTDDPEIIRSADQVIFPGQGRFGPAMDDLRRTGLDQVLTKLTQPFLGICLGMQILFDESEEDNAQGLGIIPGKVKRFSGTQPVPHMGWNTVVSGSDTLGYAYFVHSYYVDTASRYVLASTQYMQLAAAIVQKDNFYGMQFHPEKSGKFGMEVLQQFCDGSLQMQPAKQTFQIMPAIDIIAGRCVRLTQGKYDAKTEYAADPVEMAKNFADAGADVIHIVDLDAAKSGQPMNRLVVNAIVNAVNIPVQIGGGIRTMQSADIYMNMGVDRMIIGTAAITTPTFIDELIAKYGANRVVVSLDVKNEQIAIRGWEETSDLAIHTVLQRLEQQGVTQVIITDISKDGMLQGGNAELMKQVRSICDMRIYAAGGITTVEDVQVMKSLHVNGVIIGKALYEGQMTVGDIAGFKKGGLTKRLIPCMDVAANEGQIRVVKGVNFINLKDAGDPVELAKAYSEEGADELVFLDINATTENRSTLYEMVQQVSRVITIPFTVGGGVKTLDDIEALLNAGADKVSIGSAAVIDKQFIQEAADRFGSQCIVISLDAKQKPLVYRGGDDRVWELYIHGGRTNTEINAVKYAQHMEHSGAGELLVNSLDRDGTQLGYDIKLLTAITTAVNIPVIASSGVGTLPHFNEAITQAKVQAVLAASVFHSGTFSVPEVKQYLSNNNIPTRI